MHKGINTKREREKAVVSEMIALYCRRRHGGKTIGSENLEVNFQKEKAIGDV